MSQNIHNFKAWNGRKNYIRYMSPILNVTKYYWSQKSNVTKYGMLKSIKEEEQMKKKIITYYEMSHIWNINQQQTIFTKYKMSQHINVT